MFSIGGKAFGALAGKTDKGSASAAAGEKEDTAGVQTVLRSQLVHDISSLRVFEEDLDDLELLGQGSYGSVHLITDKLSGNRRVLKSVIRPESWNQDRLRMEGLIMKNIDHPHILRLFEWFENGDLAKLVCELCEGGELLSTIRKGRGNGVTMEEKWGACAMRQTFQALSYLHNKNIVHKDLKGENLLLLRNTVGDDGRDFGKLPHVCVCDLGTAEICGRGLAALFGKSGTRVAGTPATMAPEALNGNCSQKSDIWSMGCVMYEMLTNQLPFNLLGSMADAAKKQVMWLELHKQGPKWDQLRCSPAGKQLCQKLLQFREGSRPSALDCLKQPWIVQTKQELSSSEKSWLRTAIRAWSHLTPCRQAFCLKMAASCPFVDRFAEAYLKIDTDFNGMLEKSEVTSALTQMGFDRDAVRSLSDSLDVNGDGTIHYLEFSAMSILSCEEDYDALLAQEFRAIAKKRGCITQIEMAPLLQELKKLAPCRIRFDEIDLNKDGKVDFKEFGNYFGRPGVEYTEGYYQKFSSGGSAGSSKMDAEPPSPKSPKHHDFKPSARPSVAVGKESIAGNSTTSTASTTASATKAPAKATVKKVRKVKDKDAEAKAAEEKRAQEEAQRRKEEEEGEEDEEEEVEHIKPTSVPETPEENEDSSEVGPSESDSAPVSQVPTSQIFPTSSRSVEVYTVSL